MRVRMTQPLQDAIQAAFTQCVECVERMSAVQFTHAADGHSSIGTHLRHVIEYFQCFLRGMEHGVVDYDARPRDAQLELDPHYTIMTLKALISKCASVTLDRTVLEVKESISTSAAPFVMVASTREREAVFLVSHLTHHLGMIKLLAERQHIMLGADIGKAAATLMHETTQIQAKAASPMSA